MSQLAEQILLAARALPEGGLLLPRSFLHLGTRVAVDKTLSRLAQKGALLRVSRGIYVAPCHGRFGTRPPSTESVLRAIEAQLGENVVASGAAEASALGLTTQTPIREVFLTSGAPRTLSLGGRYVEIRRLDIALLKILEMGDQEVAAGKVKPMAEVVARLRAKRPNSSRRGLAGTGESG